MRGRGHATFDSSRCRQQVDQFCIRKGRISYNKNNQFERRSEEEKELEEKEGRDREDEREGACNLRLVEVTRDTEVETWPARLPATIAISCTRREGWRREKVLTTTSERSVRVAMGAGRSSKGVT